MHHLYRNVTTQVLYLVHKEMSKNRRWFCYLALVSCKTAPLNFSFNPLQVNCKIFKVVEVSSAQHGAMNLDVQLFGAKVHSHYVGDNYYYML